MSHKNGYRFVGLIIVLILMATISTPRSVRAAGPWYVATTGNDSNSCSSPGNPCLTINGAISMASEGDTINVATGIYTSSSTEVVLINKSVTISGGWNAAFATQSGMSTIDSQGTRRGITINNGATAIVEHITVQNGSAISGGGIYNTSVLTLNASIISNNTTTNNTYGGGIYNSGILTINTSTIKDNIGDYQGGGIYNSNSGNLVLTNSTVSNNSISYYSGEGGGINNDGGIMTLNNVTVSGNQALGGRGGGISNGGTATISNVTITNNQTTEGGGISNLYAISLLLRNSIVAGNAAVNAPDCYDNSDYDGLITSAGYNLVGNTANCAYTVNTGDLTNVDARLASLGNNGGATFTHALYANSPAINAGNPATPGSGGNACLATDQRGTSRPISTACDIGAFESPPITYISGNAGVAGTILSYTDGISQTVIANGSGIYSFAVPSGWSGTVTPSKSGLTFLPINRIYTNVVTNQTAQDYIAIQDPSFESYTPNPYWSEFSTNFGTPLCTVAVCGDAGGTAGPRTGSTWGWFGGVSTNETASLSQTITIPSGFPKLKLQFYFWIGAVESGSDNADVFTAKIDGVTVFSANATQQGLYPVYTPILVDISAFADSASHTITFSSVTTGQGVTFNLDDVALVNVTFSDFPADYWALQFIERLYNAGITGGCLVTPLNYCPETTVTRSQMAVFLLRGIHGSAYNPPAVGDSTGFGDVPVDYWAAAWIKQLAAEGITGGCGSGNYCPEYPVTRSQMAVFLLRSKYGASYSPPSVGGSTGFGDVPTNYWAAAWVKQLVTEGITAGCGNGNYCPEYPVTRAQMAVFLVRTFNLP